MSHITPKSSSYCLYNYTRVVKSADSRSTGYAFFSAIANPQGIVDLHKDTSCVSVTRPCVCENHSKIHRDVALV